MPSSSDFSDLTDFLDLSDFADLLDLFDLPDLSDFSDWFDFSDLTDFSDLSDFSLAAEPLRELALELLLVLLLRPFDSSSTKFPSFSSLLDLL